MKFKLLMLLCLMYLVVSFVYFITDTCITFQISYQIILSKANKGPLSIPNTTINTLRPRQNGRHFPDDIFNCIFLNENAWISNNISLKIVPKGQINNIPALVQIMARCRPGDKPLSEPMMVRLPTHICVTRPQWVKVCHDCDNIFTMEYIPLECDSRTFKKSVYTIFMRLTKNDACSQNTLKEPGFCYLI